MRGKNWGIKLVIIENAGGGGQKKAIGNCEFRWPVMMKLPEIV
jgi:hypothetical protein